MCNDQMKQMGRQHFSGSVVPGYTDVSPETFLVYTKMLVATRHLYHNKCEEIKKQAVFKN